MSIREDHLCREHEAGSTNKDAFEARGIDHKSALTQSKAQADEEICRLLSRGRQTLAFEALVVRYQAKVFRLVLSMVVNVARAEEVTQDIFLKVWQSLRAYDGRAALSTWIYAIARNTSISHLRAESYRRVLPLEEAPEPASRVPSGLSSLEVAQLVERLPDAQRQVVTLFYLQERSIEEVALMLDLPEGTVKSHLHRGRKTLAAMMEVKR
jgi:RNA polymerase sigma-70 factor (ECF subfamily)